MIYRTVVVSYNASKFIASFPAVGATSTITAFDHFGMFHRLTARMRFLARGICLKDEDLRGLWCVHFIMTHIFVEYTLTCATVNSTCLYLMYSCIIRYISPKNVEATQLIEETIYRSHLTLDFKVMVTVTFKYSYYRRHQERTARNADIRFCM